MKLATIIQPLAIIWQKALDLGYDPGASWRLLLGLFYEAEHRVIPMLAMPGIEEDSSPAPSSSAPAKNAPSRGTVRIDPLRQQRATALAAARRRASRVYVIIFVAVIMTVIISALLSPQPFALPDALVSALLATPVLNWQLAGWSPLLVLAFSLLVSTFWLIITQPFVWYTGFVIPRRYGLLKNTTTRAWLRARSKYVLTRYVKAWLLVEVVTLLIAVQPRVWWAWAALIQFLFSLLLARFGARWLLPLLVKVVPLPEGVLTERLRTQLDNLHIPTCDIFLLANGSARAFFAGWGKGRCIILTTALVQHFTLDEIEVILAHELAHLIHHDIWKRLAIRGLAFLGFFFFVSLVLAWFTKLHSPLAHLSLDSFSPSHLLLGDLTLLLVWGLFSVCILLERRSRRFQEYRADEFALQTTARIQAFKSAMIRLTNINMTVAAPTGRTGRYSTHPSLVDRLKHADEFAARQPHP